MPFYKVCDETFISNSVSLRNKIEFALRKIFVCYEC